MTDPTIPVTEDELHAYVDNELPAERRDELGSFNSHVQCGYFLLAARAVGLDCGPMGGFDRTQVDAAFFPAGSGGRSCW